MIFNKQLNRLIARNDVVLSLSGVHNPKALCVGLAKLLDSGWNMVSIDKDCVVLKSSNGITFNCRRTVGDDFMSLSQFFGGEYALEYGYPSLFGTDFTGKTVLDVGMYSGDSSIYFASRGALLVVGLEPSPKNFNLARINIESNGLGDKIVAINAALGSGEGESSFMMSEESPLSDTLHLHELKIPRFQSYLPTRVKVTTISNIMNRLKIRKFDIVKMNCEGCEFEVLRALKPNSYTEVSEFFVDLHGPVSDLMVSLERSGYILDRKQQASGHLHAVRIDASSSSQPEMASRESARLR